MAFRELLIRCCGLSRHRSGLGSRYPRPWWSLYRARRRIDLLAAHASTLETALASKTSSSHPIAISAEDESGLEPGSAGPERTDARRRFRFRDHPLLTAVAIVLFGIFFGWILIPFLFLAALPLAPAILGVLRYRAQLRIRVLTA